MSPAEKKPPQNPAIVIPVCPHCGAELPNLGIFMWQIPNGMIVALHCPACKVALHFNSVLGQPMEQKSPLMV